MSTVMKQAEELRLVPMDLIDTSVECRPVNKAHVERLSESINEIGVEQPVVLYARDGRYVLGPGRHRYEACRKLQHAEIPAIVRPDAPDAQIRQAQMIENLQRENMNPLEEAQGCEQLLEECGGNVDRVAVVIGRSKKWVEQRLSFSRLSPRVHELIVNGQLPLEYAYLIARVASPEKQEEIAGDVAGEILTAAERKESFADERPAALHRVRELVEQAMRTLKGVPWKLDAEFADKPRCDTCPSNSLNQPMLFSDGKQKDPECLDQECYEHKRKVCGSAVRKAVNYIGKESLAATPANAEKAAEAREVSFVNPKVVVEQAKNKAEPAKKTKSEQKGRDKGDQERALRSELSNRVSVWQEKLDEQLSTKMRKDPVACGIFLLIQMVDEYGEMSGYSFHHATSKKKAVIESKVLKLVDLLKSPSGDGLAKVAKEIKAPDRTWGTQTWPLDSEHYSNDLPEAVRLRLCKIYEIEVADKPTIEQVKADLEQAAKAAAEPAPAVPAEDAAAPAKKAAKKKKRKPVKNRSNPNQPARGQHEY